MYIEAWRELLPKVMDPSVSGFRRRMRTKTDFTLILPVKGESSSWGSLLVHVVRTLGMKQGVAVGFYLPADYDRSMSDWALFAQGLKNVRYVSPYARICGVVSKSDQLCADWSKNVSDASLVWDKLGTFPYNRFPERPHAGFMS